MHSRQALLPSMHMMLIMPKNWNISYKTFMEIVAESKSYAEVLQKCKSSNIKSAYTMKKIIKQMDLSTLHFTKKRKRVKSAKPSDTAAQPPVEFTTHMDDIYDEEKVQDILQL